MQRLIQPLNNMIISASFKNANYEKKFGFKHWGVDAYGDSNAWFQGFGVVLAKGRDNMYGNYISVLYPDCYVLDGETSRSVVANYFHFASLNNLTIGASVTPDTKMGIIGQTGTYATGVHLHTEMRLYHEHEGAKMVSPFGSQYFKQDNTAKWFDPIDIMHRDTGTYPQTRKIADSIYCDANDVDRMLEVRRTV